MTLSPIEQEAVILQVVVESIEGMVNHEVLNFSSDQKYTVATAKSLSQLAMFNVLLADMLEAVDSELLGLKGNLLEALRAVAEGPHLVKGDAVANLQIATNAFADWLNQEIAVQAWFPSIEIDFKQLTLKRRDSITICGNISKHNMSRLTINAKRLAKLFGRNGVKIEPLDALRALDDFYGRFHDDILVYHTTTIAELLTNVRWGIHEYLLPEYQRAYIPPSSVDDPRYSFLYPSGMVNPYAQSRYWDLMNSVRARPWVPKFVGTPGLKGQY